MRCPSCFKPVADHEVSCPHCGTSLSLWKPPASHPVAGDESASMVYAGFWARVGARVIDGVITYLAILFVMLLAVLLTGGMDAFSGEQLHSEPPPLFGVLVFAALLIGPWLYFALMESSSWQATLGKRALGMRVTDLHGQRISFAQATGRYFATILCYLTLYIGFLMAAFTHRKQALHDMVASTVVSYRDGKANQTGCLIVAIVTALFFVAWVGILAAIAIPAYQDYVKKGEEAKAAVDAGEQGEGDMAGATTSQSADVVDMANMLATGVEDVYGNSGALPMSMDEMEIEVDESEGLPMGTVGEQGVVTVFTRDGSLSLTMRPTALQDGSLGWQCDSDGFADVASLPERCH